VCKTRHFDLVVPQVGDGVFEVLSTSGDTHLGGDDFDKRIVDWLADDFQKNEGLDLRKDRQVCPPCFIRFLSVVLAIWPASDVARRHALPAIVAFGSGCFAHLRLSLETQS